MVTVQSIDFLNNKNTPMKDIYATNPVALPPQKVTDPVLTQFNQQQVKATNPTTGTNTTTGAQSGVTGQNPVTGAASTDISGLYGDKTMADLYGSSLDYYKGQGTQVIDENAIRAQKLAEIQAQIDATNTLYANKLSQAKQTGAGRIGEGTAIQARRGLIGSDFGTAQSNQINDANNEIYAGVEAERNAKVQALLSQAKTDATAEIALKTAAKEAGLKNYLDYLAKADERKVTSTTKLVQALLAQDIDPSGLDNASIDALAKSYGISSSDLKNSYFTAKKTSEAEAAKAALDTAKIQSEIDKNNIYSVGDGTQTYKYDPKTGKTTLVANNPKTFAPKESTGGTYSGGTNGAATDILAKAKSIDPTIRSYAESLLAKTTTLASIPANIRNQVMDATSVVREETGIMKANQALKRLDDAISIIEGSKPGDRLSGAIAGASLPLVGRIAQFGSQPAANLNIQLDGIKALGTLDNLNLMKGTGPLSNADLAVLANASVDFASTQDEQTLLKKLTELRNELEPARIANNPNPRNQPVGGYAATDANQPVEFNGYQFPNQAALDAYKREAGIQ